jgi:phage repressor protein C with HTH and peptisase S24 domain
MWRRLGLVLGAAFAFLAAAGAQRFMRVAVSGHSMEPLLRDGDWLIVERAARVRPGDIVVARDPRAIGRIIVKRVSAANGDATYTLASDHFAHANETIGPVVQRDVVGRVRVIYWPVRRARVI